MRLQNNFPSLLFDLFIRMCCFCLGGRQIENVLLQSNQNLQTHFTVHQEIGSGVRVEVRSFQPALLPILSLLFWIPILFVLFFLALHLLQSSQLQLSENIKALAERSGS